MDTAEGERLRRWRLVLGEEAQASCGLAGLSPEDRQMDEALAALYEAGSRHSLRGGSGASSPRVARWLGDIRRFFPSSVVQVMQKDAFERLNLHSMLLQPEMLESVQPDVNLVSTLMSLRGIIPEKTKETARLVVRKVVDVLMKQLEEPMRTAVSGALNRAVRNRRPRHAEIDWNRTIRANLKHWQQEYKTIVPETLIGYGRKSQRVQREIILCIDQSGSMASSVVYSSIFGAVMASMPAVKTHLVVFDTAVVDMTEQLDDPVDLLFGVQLGGGGAAELHRAGTVVVQVDDCRDKVFFFCVHTSSTSSRSYTVLILPLSTLTSFGSSLMTRTTVGRESSISLAFKIGFMLNRLLW